MKINNKNKLFYNTISFIFVIFLLSGCVNSNKSKTQSHIQQPDNNIINNTPPNNLPVNPQPSTNNNVPVNPQPSSNNNVPVNPQPSTNNNVPVNPQPSSNNNVPVNPQKPKEEKEKSNIENNEKKEKNNYSSYKGNIKGNINSKIYHLPDGAYYDKISEKNTVYFDSEEEAINAGYRRSKR